MITYTSQKMKKKPEIITIVEKGLCSGCGVCAGVCPKKCLEMKENEFGEYYPSLFFDKCISCFICDDVCPFYKELPYLCENLFSKFCGEQKNEQIGYYSKSFCGGIADLHKRKERSSGGLASWVLQQLLDKKIVDRVILVQNKDCSSKLFDFTEISNSDDVWTASRSCYYPVEISDILSKIVYSNCSYAVIGLPCLLKGLRNAQEKIPILKKRIKILLGLVCSHQKSKWFAEYFIRILNIEMDTVKNLSFRCNKNNKPARESMGIEISTHNGLKIVDDFKKYILLWGGGFFKLGACNYCNDLFAYYADAVFMDAWLPKYWNDPIGTSIVVTRTLQMNKLFQKGMEDGSLSINEIDIGDVIYSQSQGRGKHIEFNCQLIISNKKLPQLWKQKIQWKYLFRVETLCRKYFENINTRVSKKAFSIQRNSGPGIEVFWKKFNAMNKQWQIFNKIVLKVFDFIRHLFAFLYKKKSIV